MAEAGELIVLWGNTPWDGHRLGAQFLAEALAEHHRVLYVDPPRSLTRVVQAGAGSAVDDLRRPRLQPVTPMLTQLRTFGPPGLRRPGVRSVNSLTLSRTVRRATARLGGPVRAVISGYLDVSPFGYCGERHRVFRVSDDFTVGAELGIPVAYTTRAQVRMAADADAVVCVSPPLVDTWRQRGYEPILVPNGCSVDVLRKARDRPRPAAIRLPDPIVGYVGQLATRIDFDLVQAVADRGHSVLLVGGVRNDLDRSRLTNLLDRSNVQWIGEVPYEEVPSLLGSMAVGLVPYTDSDFNRASFPLKILEYLGAGLATVATDLPAVRWLGSDLVRVARSPDSFAEAVEVSLRVADDPVERAARYELAAMHSWEKRADDYLALFDRLDAERCSSASSTGGSQSASS